MVVIKEEFDSNGDFSNYDVYDAAQRTQLENQKHRDIRTFNNDHILCPIRIFELSRLTMTFLNSQQVSQIAFDDTSAATFIIRPGELWTAGTVGKQLDRNRQYGISLSCVAGINTTSSVLLT